MKSPLFYELQSTGMLRKVPSRELRAALGELLSLNKLVTPFYEMSLRALTAPDFSPEIVTYGLRDEEGKRGDGTLRVASVDTDRARLDPLFRRRILQRIVPEAAGRTLPESCETAP